MHSGAEAQAGDDTGGKGAFYGIFGLGEKASSPIKQDTRRYKPALSVSNKQGCLRLNLFC